MARRIQILSAACLMAAILFIGVDLCKCSVYAETTIFTVSEYEADVDDENIALDFQDNVTVTEVTSSNTKVVTVGFRDEDEYDYYDEDNDTDEDFGSFVYLHIEGVGKSVITAKDSEGNTDTCLVTVKPSPLILSDTEIVLSEYDPECDTIVCSESNQIKSVKSSDNTIAKGILVYYDEVRIKGITEGTAILTITDIYNQTAEVSVEVTQKYIDEKTYLPIMIDACQESEDEWLELFYGDTYLDFRTDISSKFKNIKIEVQIGNNTYPAKYQGYDYGYYYSQISKIPTMPVGTNIVCTLTKGDVKYIYKTKIKTCELGDDAEFWLGNDEVYSFVYSGRTIKPSTTVMYGYRGGSKTIKKGTDYTVKYTNNLNVGTAKATVTGKGNYKGSLTCSFKIIPKGTSLVKLTAKKKAFAVKWKKQSAKMSKSRITGYQIRYATKSNMSGAKTVKVKGYAKTVKSISKLKAKTKYHVQIRTYKIVSGTTYYSKWSAKKVIKTK